MKPEARGMNLRWTTRRAFAAGAMLAVLAPLHPAPAEEKFSDITCPATVASVVTFTAVTQAKPLDTAALLAAAIAAGDNYEVCAQQQRTDQRIEPQSHYAQFRAAQYYVVAARVEIQAGKIDAARKHLAIARQDATDVVGWQPFGSGSATKHSVWADKSKQILEAVETAAQELPPSGAATPPP